MNISVFYSFKSLHSLYLNFNLISFILFDLPSQTKTWVVNDTGF